jgi:hypothetical protein
VGLPAVGENATTSIGRHILLTSGGTWCGPVPWIMVPAAERAALAQARKHLENE